MSWVRRHPALGCAVALLVRGLSVWAVKLDVLAQSVSSNASFWAQPQGETGGLLYVALGDSAAQAIGASSPDLG